MPKFESYCTAWENYTDDSNVARAIRLLGRRYAGLSQKDVDNVIAGKGKATQPSRVTQGFLLAKRADWGRNHGSSVRNALAKYSKIVFDDGSSDGHRMYNLSMLLKKELIADGDEIDLQGSLAAALQVINTKCETEFIDIDSVNSQISKKKSLERTSKSVRGKYSFDYV